MQTKAFDRVFIVMFENETVDAVRANPYMLNLESRGVRLSQYFGVTHPSQPNYIASTCGAALVFDDTRRSVEKLCKELQARGFQADAIHGGKTQ